MQGGHRIRNTALRHHVTGAAFAATALGGYAQFELDFIEAHASTRMAGNLSVGNPAANTDDHGEQAVWLAVEGMLAL